MALFAFFLTLGSNAFAKERWSYTAANDGVTCRTEVAIPERDAGFSIVRMQLRGKETFIVGLYFHHHNSDSPPTGPIALSQVRVDGKIISTLEFEHRTVTDLGTLGYLSIGQPSQAFLDSLMSGSMMTIYVDAAMGSVDVSLTGSRPAIEGWQACVEKGRKSAGEGRGLAIYKDRSSEEHQPGLWMVNRGGGTAGPSCGITTFFIDGAPEVAHLVSITAHLKSKTITGANIILYRVEPRAAKLAPKLINFKLVIDGEDYLKTNISKIEDINGPAYIAYIDPGNFIELITKLESSMSVSIESNKYFNADLGREGIRKAISDVKACVSADD